MKKCLKCKKAELDKSTHCRVCGCEAFIVDIPAPSPTLLDWAGFPWGQLEAVQRAHEHYTALHTSGATWQSTVVKDRRHFRNLLLSNIMVYSWGHIKDAGSGLHPLAHVAILCLYLMHGDGAPR